MPVRSGWWQGQSDPERFETYNRWSLYVLVMLGPFVGVLATASFSAEAGLPGWFAPLYLLAYLAQTVTAEVTLAGALDHYLGRRAWPRRLVAGLVAATTSLLVLAAVLLQAIPWESTPVPTARMAGWLLLAPLAIALSAAAPMIRTRVLAAIGVALVALSGAAVAVFVGDASALLAFGISGALVMVGVVLSFRVAAWMIGVVWDLDRRREVDARLAVAEERLRFSRDLHDIFGRTLSTVAVTSELAAELARRGDPRGAEKMLEVRQISQDALREVRSVVDGYRRADLPTELAGATDILRSAGVSVSVHGESTPVGERAAEALAWVVREAVTNVVRHADARIATISLFSADGAATVEVANDGVRPLASPRPGSGLRGLSERLASVGGSIESGAGPDGSFRVRARVPDAAIEETR
ncbi:histidine kinase [Ruania suaedae]|uniref:sensor histidine kinase n=1 Tax=Ruania suaedae TaxID=2897774 RepID=UPI001E655770|nr:histidine kinase [Ruania suaedae]UFU01994.1 histidine kinase [Ruania suaedae]